MYSRYGIAFDEKSEWCFDNDTARNVVIFGVDNSSSSNRIMSSSTEFKEVSLNANVYDFLVNYKSIDKSDILNIRNNLMTKNNIK